MHITLAMVMSINGRTTAGRRSSVHDWSSTEDKTYFDALKKKHNLILMGRNTFTASRKQITLSSKTLRVVFTKTPHRFIKETVADQLTFTNASPNTVVKGLERRGFTRALLVGGAELNSAFLKAGLIHELWITVEPALFEGGKGLFEKIVGQQRFQLVAVKRMNKEGTLLLKYRR
ncbi:MAG: dihydrofolate reductase family protein [Candidatus Taylorbacteria bacterium]|nr:dihydrofolate reductase family protein [Candidatus Taylorbacteria bacterium]